MQIPDKRYKWAGGAIASFIFFTLGVIGIVGDIQTAKEIADFASVNGLRINWTAVSLLVFIWCCFHLVWVSLPEIMAPYKKRKALRLKLANMQPDLPISAAYSKILNSSAACVKADEPEWVAFRLLSQAIKDNRVKCWGVSQGRIDIIPPEKIKNEYKIEPEMKNRYTKDEIENVYFTDLSGKGLFDNILLNDGQVREVFLPY